MECTWEAFSLMAGLIASLLSILGAFLFAIKWMFDKLSKKTVILTQKVDAIHQELSEDMKEIRSDVARAHARIDATLERMDHNQAEANRRMDHNQAEANRRMDEANKRMDYNQAEANRRMDETNKRTDAALERIDKMYEILMLQFTHNRTAG